MKSWLFSRAAFQKNVTINERIQFQQFFEWPIQINRKERQRNKTIMNVYSKLKPPKEKGNDDN